MMDLSLINSQEQGIAEREIQEQEKMRILINLSVFLILSHHHQKDVVIPLLIKMKMGVLPLETYLVQIKIMQHLQEKLSVVQNTHQYVD